MGRPPAGPTVPGRKRGRPPKNRNSNDTTNNTNNNSNTTTSSSSATTTSSPASIRTVCYYRRGSIPQASTTSQSAPALSSSSGTGGNDNVNGNGGQYQFPRRYPRISGYYQMKDIPIEEMITESTYTSSRCAPIPMSSVVPFRTECEIQNEQIHYYDSGKVLLFHNIRRITTRRTFAFL